MARPDGEGEPSVRAEAHYRRAVQLARGSLAAPHVAWAESVCIPREDRDCFDKALDAAFAVDIGKYPDNRLENSIMLQRAAWLRANADRLIIREAAP
jgi:predicted anti-sigma-YlaC factor YlaD